jgi:deoxyribonuclease V
LTGVALPQQPTHRWDLSPEEARVVQERLRTQIVADAPLPLESITWVAGVDISVKDDTARAAVVLLRFPALTVAEVALAERPVTFPYVPGLLAFREGPSILDAFEKLHQKPDAIIFDGHGLAHPRRMGIACHMGLWTGIPSVGCAKSILVGNHGALGDQRGAWAPLVHNGAVVGVAVRTRNGVQPVYVSVGHLADLDTARELVLRCCTSYRLPEPTRQAHRAAGGEDVLGSAGEQLSLF